MRAASTIPVALLVACVLGVAAAAPQRVTQETIFARLRENNGGLRAGVAKARLGDCIRNHVVAEPPPTLTPAPPRLCRCRSMPRCRQACRSPGEGRDRAAIGRCWPPNPTPPHPTPTDLDLSAASRQVQPRRPRGQALSPAPRDHLHHLHGAEHRPSRHHLGQGWAGRAGCLHLVGLQPPSFLPTPLAFKKLKSMSHCFSQHL